MASWQAYLTVLFLKVQVKRKMRGETDVKKARATLGAIKHKVPAGVTQAAATLGGVAGEWLRTGSDGASGTLLYLHGGGYFACSPETHRPITAGFAKRGLDVFAPDYRLAPENPFPAAVDDAVAVYRALVAAGTPPDKIVVGGDSAGGGLTLSMLLTLRKAGDTLPAAAILFSPWTDLAGTGETLKTNSARDAMFDGKGMEQASGPYLNGVDPRDPVASPIYADLSGLPPMLIHAGSYEVLLDDSRRLAQRATAAGTPATLKTWPVVPHVWQLFPIPEARESLDAAAGFLKQAMHARDRRLAA